ncbi:MAG: HAD-IA family hydrolase [Beijerinckiaceae bacterium]
MPSPVRHSRRTLVLLDLDGTVVDGQHSIRATFEAVFPQFGYAAPGPQAVRSIVGLSLPFAIAHLLGPDAPANRIAEAYKDHFHEMRATPGYSEALYDHVDASIRRMAARDDLLLGTATGKALRGINWLIDKHGWHGFFATLQASDTAASKPSPEMVFNACSETGMEPEDVIVFGDSIYDMQMAVNAGARGIGVSWGYGGREELIEAGASRIIDSFAEVETMVDLFHRNRIGGERRDA